MPRTARLSVMISHEIKAELKSTAESMGMTESALTAFIIGQWLTTQRQVQKSLQGLMGSPEMARFVTSAVPDVEPPTVDRIPERGKAVDGKKEKV